ncbi:uncharacterized protein Bfra_005189 [Botrytis fragariae]|uniref:Uncharacterized protein n=1 Tax=Botrytis fragariae TaxID=1964551 RepID=A0A8H6AUM5_9HELO|nr:uncharacterized protein Bfra_005189 [Botrytis fragariae]KAF5873725.1 hypothetical protein Bfra_005189 [Botrytis fragariae]
MCNFGSDVDADDEPVDVWAQLVETQFPYIKFSSLDRHSRGEPAHCTNAQRCLINLGPTPNADSSSGEKRIDEAILLSYASYA